MAETVSLDAAPPPARSQASLFGADEGVRVRLGASPQTGPELLLTLAGDPSVTVRGAVAINRAAPRAADHLLAGDRDERVRTLLARKLSNLVPGVPDVQRGQMQDQALAILNALVEDEAERVRAAIADVVKDLPAAPRELILRLARDSAVSVCDPVIRLSPLLSAEDLMALLATRPSEATASAIARRPGLAEAVCDAVANSGDTEAVTALLANPTAAIREATLDALVARAADVTTWHAPLVHRPRLTARAARALSDIVATQLLDVLARRGDLDPAVSLELRQRLSRRLDAETGRTSRPDPDIDQAFADARAAFASGQLNEAELLASVQRGEVRMATAFLAVAADVSISVVERAATLRSAKGLVSLVWKAGYSMRLAGPLQTLLARLAPEKVLRATPSGSFPLAVEEMRWQLDFLGRVGR
jgi:uncharacterized protein (DUF2336 family)